MAEGRDTEAGRRDRQTEIAMELHRETDEDLGTEITFTGMVCPAAWDEADGVAEVEIKPWGRFEDPGPVKVDRSSVGQDLLSFLFRTVTVTGYVRPDEYGDRIMYITDYEVEEEERPLPFFVHQKELPRPHKKRIPRKGGGRETRNTKRRPGRAVPVHIGWRGWLG